MVPRDRAEGSTIKFGFSDIFLSMATESGEYIVAGPWDEANKKGHRTRFLRFEPGEFTKAPFVHGYWEEVWLVSGDLIVGNDAEGNGGESFTKAVGNLPEGFVKDPVWALFRLQRRLTCTSSAQRQWSLVRGVAPTQSSVNARESPASRIAPIWLWRGE